MTDALTVVLDDQVAGIVSRLPQGRLRFDYDPSYGGRAGATPLSLSMPIQVASHADHVIRPWLAGLLPENEAVISRWARHFHISTSSPFALLGTPVGEDCAGAVRFAPPHQLERILQRPGAVDSLTKAGVASRLRDLREDSTAWLGRSFTGQFSLAGVQPKTALLLRQGRWGVPSGSTPTTHILKPATAGFDDHDLNEHLCLSTARRVGLLAVRTRVLRFGRESALVVDRYDRTIVGSDIRRIHQEDVCQALGIQPSKKYQNEGGPGPRDIADLLRRTMKPSVADASVWQFADALIFNWLIAGTDAHAKNYSLLLAGNQVRLAPLYDVASSLPYGTDERRLRFAMKIGGDYRVFPQHNTWPDAARDLGVDADRIVARVRELASSLPQALSEAAGAPEVRALTRSLPAKLVDLVADRTARCVMVLDRLSS
ncbi:MAG: type II toxin-antitoxin system HipA family toxin [Candidatus Dormibacteria bacterium]